MSYAMGLVLAMCAGMFLFGWITLGVLLAIAGLCTGWMCLVAAIMGDRA